MVSGLPDVELELWGPAFARIGWVNDAASLTLTLRHNARSIATLVVDADHVRAADLAAPGARLLVIYRGVQVFSGRVTTRQAQGPIGSSTLTVTVVGDWRHLDGALAWPVPANAIGSQTSAYWTASGPAETVIKDLVIANVVTRLGRPITVATDLGRGATVAASLRFDPIGDAVRDLATAGGIGVSLAQSGSTILLDCYAPTDRTARTLSEANGTLSGSSWTGSDATATRTIVGGQGEGTARILREVVASATEAAEQDLVEVFSDAADLTSTADLDARGAANLAQAGPTSGISVQLAETDTIGYGTNLALGDLVRVEVLPGITVDDTLSQVTLSWTADEGLVVTPAVGDPDSTTPDSITAALLARMAAAIKQLRRR